MIDNFVDRNSREYHDHSNSDLLTWLDQKILVF